MQLRPYLLYAFVIFFLSSIFLLALSKTPFLTAVRGEAENILRPLQAKNQIKSSTQTEIQKLRAENDLLIQELVKLKSIEQDNQALRDQFAQFPSTSRVQIPALVLNLRGNEEIMLDKGELDGVKNGMAVIVGKNLLGRVIQVTPHRGIIELITSPNFSLPGKTLATNAIGIIRGTGDQGLVFDNVILTEKLVKGDVVMAKEENIPPGFILGKIETVERKESALYQLARVRSLIDLNRINLVFILLR